MLNELKKEMQNKANPEKAKLYERFFKTGKGQYGEGDKFLGLTVPEIKDIVKKYNNLNLNDIQELLKNEIHEFRTCGISILVHKYKNSENKKEIVDFYLKNSKRINNWDLVDISASKILGNYLLDKDKILLYKLAKSDILWERRIAIISTFEFIRNNQFRDALKISEILLNDKNDLIYKAVGWMLREIGKRDLEKEEEFLKKYHKTMPRTMLRYAIEKFNKEKKEFYMKK